MNTNKFYQKIKLGQQPIVGKTILHTAPHHDDILLGYFPYAVRNLAGNTNHVLYVTSGANGVSDRYLAQSYPNVRLEQLDDQMKQELKFQIRESESQAKWNLLCPQSIKIKHLRAEFYSSEKDQQSAAFDRDVARVVDYLQEIKPDVITLLVDPIGIGPTTHYRSQQVIVAALKKLTSSYAKASSFVKTLADASADKLDIEIIGYRNVWSSFTLDEASMIVPVTQDELDLTESIFMSCFGSQKNNFVICDNGQPCSFAQQATEIQQAQLHKLYACDPEILKSSESKLENFVGAIFLQKLTIDQL